jgi:hypothetical protein
MKKLYRVTTSIRDEYWVAEDISQLFNSCKFIEPEPGEQANIRIERIPTASFIKGISRDPDEYLDDQPVGFFCDAPTRS